MMQLKITFMLVYRNRDILGSHLIRRGFSNWQPPATLRALLYANVVAHHLRRSVLNIFTCC